MRTIKAINNFKVDMVITFSLIALGFYIRTIFISNMGSEETGLVLLYTQLTAYLNLAELGIGIAAASVLYKPLHEDDYARVNYITSLLSLIYRFISFIVLVVGIVIGLGIYFFIDSVASVHNALIYWSMFVINASLTYTYAKHSTLLTANQQYSIVRKIQGGGKIIILISQCFIIYYTHSFLFYLLVETIGILLQYVLFNANIKRGEFNELYTTDIGERDKLELKIDLKNKIKNMFFHKIGAVLVLNTDYLLVSKFLNLTYVTIYGSYMMVFQVVTVLMSSFINAITAGMGSFLINKSEEDKIIIARQFNVAFIALATFICINMFFLVNDFILQWIGARYILSNYVVFLMLINVFISVIRIPTDIFKNASGLFGDIYYPLFEGLINLFFSTVLTIYFGLSGVVFGTIISNIIITLIAKPLYLYSRMFKLSSASNIYCFFVMRPIIYAISIFSLCTVVYYKFELFTVSSWLDFIIKTICVSLISMIIVFIVFYTDRYFRGFINRVVKAFCDSH